MKLANLIISILILTPITNISAQTYTGNIDNKAVTVCLDNDGLGLYYNDNDKVLRFLREENDSINEYSNKWSNEPLATWIIKRNEDGSKITGSKEHLKSKNKQIILEKIDSSMSECSPDNKNFIEKLNIIEKLKVDELIKYDESRYYYSSTFNSGKSYQINTLRFERNKIGYSNINSLMEKYSGKEYLEEIIFGCRNDALYEYREGEAIVNIKPTFWTNDWLQISVNEYLDCGGMRAGGNNYNRVFNITTGEEFNLAEWFKNSEHNIGKDQDAMKLDDDLIQKIVNNIDLSVWFDDECKSDDLHLSTFMSIRLSYEGAVFNSNGKCNACRVCGFKSTVSYDDLMPFLNINGINEVTSIKKSIPTK